MVNVCLVSITCGSLKKTHTQHTKRKREKNINRECPIHRSCSCRWTTPSLSGSPHSASHGRDANTRACTYTYITSSLRGPRSHSIPLACARTLHKMCTQPPRENATRCRSQTIRELALARACKNTTTTNRSVSERGHQSAARLLAANRARTPTPRARIILYMVGRFHIFHMHACVRLYDAPRRDVNPTGSAHTSTRAFRSGKLNMAIEF